MDGWMTENKIFLTIYVHCDTLYTLTGVYLSHTWKGQSGDNNITSEFVLFSADIIL